MKSMRILLLYCIMFTVCVSGVSAEDEPANSEEYRHGIGFAAGFVTGYGLSYRYLGEKFNFQFTFAPYVGGDEVVISTGTAVLRNLYIGDTSRLFLYSGLHYWYHSYANQSEESEVTPDGESNDQRLNCGIGPGIEFSITDNIVFNVMAGYAVYLRNNDATMINFTGELALFFYFE